MSRLSLNERLPHNAMMILWNAIYGGDDGSRDVEDAGFIAGAHEGSKGPTATDGGGTL